MVMGFSVEGMFGFIVYVVPLGMMNDATVLCDIEGLVTHR